MDKSEKKKIFSLSDISFENDEYTLDELAELLGISIYTIRRRIYDGRLKAVKVGGQYKVKKEDVEDFLIREEIGKKLEYFSKKGELYKKQRIDEEKLEEEAIYLVEQAKVLACTDAARIYYERNLYNRRNDKYGGNQTTKRDDGRDIKEN